MLPWLAPDGRLILLTTSLRSFAVGFVSVLLALYLKETGLDPVRVGAVLAAVLAGNAFFTTLASLFADHFGRKRSFMSLSMLTILGGALFPLTGSFILLLFVGGMAGFGLGGKDRAAQSSLEQPVLARAAPAERRTMLFAYYNVIGGLASAVGALCSGMPVILENTLGMDIMDGYRLMFFLYAAIGAIVTLVYLRLTPAAEAPAVDGRRVGITLPRRSKGIIYRLAALGAMDSFGGGFMFQTFLAYWFNLRYDLTLESLAGVFFAANIISSFSAIMAAWLARRIGLINTMVWTHIPANLLVVAMAFSPFAWLTIAMLLLRESMSQMDVPTRQSFTMAVVAPEEQTVAAGMSTLGRQGGQMPSPYISGLLVAASLANAPLIVGGLVKVVYDLLLWQQFRNVRPPEEQSRPPERASAKPAAPVDGAR
ncbi:MAG: MFS transporter [Chloroflexi bacterium]|nr:MFS transporter [Chloroflexota bacterium]